METRKFHIGDILTVITGRLLSPNHAKGLCEFLDFMTGVSWNTHQFPSAIKYCKPYLLEQFPQFEDVDASVITRENWKEWLDEQIGHFGEELIVRSVSEGERKSIFNKIFGL